MQKADFVSIVLILLFPLSIVSVSSFTVVFDLSFYPPLFEKYEVHNSIENPQAMNKEVLDFLKGKNNFLPEIFNKREIAHMEDVKEKFTILKRILILFPFLLCAALIKWKTKRKIMFIKVLRKGSLLTIGIFGIMIMLMIFAFPLSLGKFHSFFFEEGTYSFDPHSEMIVVLYPEGLLGELGMKIGTLSLIFSGLIYVYAVALLLKQKDIKEH